MLTEALQYLVGLKPEPWIGDVGGKLYSNEPIFPMKDPEPSPIIIHTLARLVDYVTGNPDNLDLSGLFMVVKSPEQVVLESRFTGVFFQRNRILTAELEERKRFQFGLSLEVESFIIALQTYFVQDATTAAILKLVGNLKDERVKTISDDGISQTVTAKTGVTKVEMVEVPNPVELRPYRTFLEVEQPVVKCVFRMQSGREGGLPSCAIFEADGGLWRIRAINDIAAYLEEKLPGMMVLA